MVDFISAADFEKKMKDIKSSNKPDSVKSAEAVVLMIVTLKSLGYDAGVDIFNTLQLTEWKS